MLAGCGGGTTATRTAEVVPPPSPVTPGGDTVRPVYLPPWNFMSLSTAGVDTFLLEHPTFDGRGVLILIFDTGIDMSIAGLQTTSDGRPKVLDALDFSNSCVIRCSPATVKREGGSVTASGGGVTIKDVDALTPAPGTGDVYIGVLNESAYRNSSVRDFDGDGFSTTRFGVLLYRTANGWRTALDANGDGSLRGDTAVGSYHERREWFLIAQQDSGKSPLTFAATIDTAARSVSFHYDMGGHGTHVAGIAAGHNINGQAGFNGIAPGAQVISCKFSGDSAGDNTVTGSMLRAYRYAARVADSMAQFHVPVVVNMSFGIGSAQEGQAEIETYIDSLLPEHPNLYVVTSAGNEGPGLSTVGIPAAAREMITVGAALPRGIGRDGYNAAIDRDIIWDFSSRGGEVDKPDIVAPGTAVSTVPRYAFEDRESGTSMASPYTAGVVALLLSALRQEDSTWTPTQPAIKRALRSGAHPLPDYAAVEQGGGMLDVRRSYALLRSWHASGFANALRRRYVVSTTSPNYPVGFGPTAFWRTAWTPDEDWRQTFRITPLASQKERRDGDFRPFTLEATADWLRPVQSVVYSRNFDQMQVDVLYDPTKLERPGLYSARIVARHAGAEGPAGKGEIEFELLNTIIVPWKLGPANRYTITTPLDTLAPGVIRRHYIAVPPGAAALRCTLSVPKGSRSNVSAKIAGREGNTLAYLPRARGADRAEAEITIPVESIGNGVVEICVQAEAFEGGGAPSPYTLSVAGVMFDVQASLEPVNGEQQLRLDVEATGVEPIRAVYSYTPKGFMRVRKETLKRDVASIPVTMHPDDGALWLTVKLAPEDYMRSTDIMLSIVDETGAQQAQQAMNATEETIFLPNFTRGDSSRLRLVVNYGAAREGGITSLPVTLIEKHVRPADPKPLGGFGQSELWPGIQRSFYSRTLSLPTIPPGFTPIVDVSVKLNGGEDPIVLERELRLSR